MSKGKRKAFTLIELLVVITIIVVLLAMLTPALDRAIHQAELAACGANLKGIAGGLATYATEQNRWYPHRRDVDEVPAWQNNKFFDPVPRRDIRITIRPYIAINAFLDPLVEPVDFDIESESHGYAPRVLWFGWYYRDEPQGMRKMGDRMTWGDHAFRVLVSDWDMIQLNQFASSAHPDADDVLLPLVSDNEPQEALIPGGGGATYNHPTNLISASYWRSSFGNSARGPVDLNFAMDDGAVLRFDDVTHDEPDNGGRMERLPWNSDHQFDENLLWTHLPGGAY